MTRIFNCSGLIITIIGLPQSQRMMMVHASTEEDLDHPGLWVFGELRTFTSGVYFGSVADRVATAVTPGHTADPGVVPASTFFDGVLIDSTVGGEGGIGHVSGVGGDGRIVCR